MTTLDVCKRYLLNYFATLLNGGTIQLFNSSSTLLVSMAFSATAFATISSGTTIIANAITADTDCTAGTISSGALVTSGGTQLATFTVGTTGTDLIISNLVLSGGEAVGIRSVDSVVQFSITM